MIRRGVLLSNGCRTVDRAHMAQLLVANRDPAGAAHAAGPPDRYPVIECPWLVAIGGGLLAAGRVGRLIGSAIGVSFGGISGRRAAVAIGRLRRLAGSGIDRLFR